MLLPKLPTTDFAPCFPHRKDLDLSIFPCGSQYGSGILTRTFESPCLSQSITEAIAEAELFTVSYQPIPPNRRICRT